MEGQTACIIVGDTYHFYSLDGSNMHLLTVKHRCQHNGMFNEGEEVYCPTLLAGGRHAAFATQETLKLYEVHTGKKEKVNLGKDTLFGLRNNGEGDEDEDKYKCTPAFFLKSSSCVSSVIDIQVLVMDDSDVGTIIRLVSCQVSFDDKVKSTVPRQEWKIEFDQWEKGK